MKFFLRLELAHKLLLTLMICSALTAAVSLCSLTRINDLGRMLAATAEEMSAQAEQLQQTMAFFKLAGTPPDETRGKAAPLVAAFARVAA